ncbi:MAG: GtrA family protein [Candidatus Saccharibacteria bacterium]
MEKLLKKHAEKIRFIVVGGLNTLIDFSILFFLVNIFSTPVFFSNIISTSVALVFSFFANKKFTFKSNNSDKLQIVYFLLITLVGLWIIQPIIISLVKLLVEQWLLNSSVILLIGKLLATCVTLVWNYLLYSKFVFKKDKV